MQGYLLPIAGARIVDDLFDVPSGLKGNSVGPMLATECGRSHGMGTTLMPRIPPWWRLTKSQRRDGNQYHPRREKSEVGSTLSKKRPN